MATLTDQWELTEEQKKLVSELETLDDQFLDDLIGPMDKNSNSMNNNTKRIEFDFLRNFYAKQNEVNKIDDEFKEKSEHGTLISYGKEAQALLNQLSLSEKYLNDLLTKYDSVAQKTSSLHEACDKLMSDQTKLTATAEEIRHRLTYFDRVDQISQKLQSPLLSVTGESFMQILTSIDETMTFLTQQSDYKEAEIYLNKCQQCLAKALNRVKQHIFQLLTNATHNVQSKFNAANSKNDDTFTLFYGLYGTHAPSVRSLMEMLEKKWDDNPQYQAMLNECYSHYFAQREILLAPSVNASMEQLKKSHSGSCLLVRSGCSILIRLCDDEVHLFSKFFTLSTDLLHDYLERLCRIFYDLVRPIVIHAPHFETLAELCSILKYEMLDDRCNLDPEIYAGFIRVISELLGDATERLVYRAQIYAREDIQNFSPSPGDLAYPDKLKMMEAITRSILDKQKMTNPEKDKEKGPENDQNKAELERKISVGSQISVTSQEVASINSLPQHILTAADLHGLWYPTVKRTVMCLSKLFRCLESTVFHGISEEILTMCIHSLNFAAQKITANKGYINGQLFIIKHLLILREQTTPFRGSCSIKQGSVDLHKYRDSAWQLLNKKSKWFSFSNNSLLEFMLQVPADIVDHVIDSRRALDLRLRDTCQELISNCTNDLVKEMNGFSDKAEPLLQQKSVVLKQLNFGTVENLQEIMNECYKKLRNNVPTWKALLSIYINNKETENILFSPIRKNVENAYQKFRKIVENQYTNEELQVISCPSQEEISMLLM